jgi:hypothetical protein
MQRSNDVRQRDVWTKREHDRLRFLVASFPFRAGTGLLDAATVSGEEPC